jgi:hypothetical protein
VSASHHLSVIIAYNDRISESGTSFWYDSSTLI